MSRMIRTFSCIFPLIRERIGQELHRNIPSVPREASFPFPERVFIAANLSDETGAQARIVHASESDSAFHPFAPNFLIEKFQGVFLVENIAEVFNSVTDAPRIAVYAAMTASAVEIHIVGKTEETVPAMNS